MLGWCATRRESAGECVGGRVWVCTGVMRTALLCINTLCTHMRTHATTNFSMHTRSILTHTHSIPTLCPRNSNTRQINSPVIVLHTHIHTYTSHTHTLHPHALHTHLVPTKLEHAADGFANDGGAQVPHVHLLGDVGRGKVHHDVLFKKTRKQKNQ